MAKFSFIVRPVVINFETTTIGQGETSRIRSVPHSIEWGGIECNPELSVQEMAQITLGRSEEIKNLREFLRAELPDCIRNVGKAVLELKEEFELQQLQQDKRQYNQNQELFGSDEKSVHRITRVWSEVKKKKD